jgi:hypothetical protein
VDDEPLSGDILPPGAPPSAPSAQSAALARRISRGTPSADLQALLHGTIREAVAEAAGYADGAIADSTRAAYVQAWAHFADWCRGKEVDPDALPLNPVLVAAYLSALAKTHGASALRSRVAAIAYHHRRRGFVFLPTHPVPPRDAQRHPPAPPAKGPPGRGAVRAGDQATPGRVPDRSGRFA